MQNLGFVRSTLDVLVFLLLYVDDLLITGPCLKSIKSVQTALCVNFDMKDLGDAQKILGINIFRDRKKSILVLHQEP